MLTVNARAHQRADKHLCTHNKSFLWQNTKAHIVVVTHKWWEKSYELAACAPVCVCVCPLVAVLFILLLRRFLLFALMVELFCCITFVLLCLFDLFLFLLCPLHALGCAAARDIFFSLSNCQFEKLPNGNWHSNILLFYK